MKIEFFKHNISEEEKQKVLECLDGLFLTTGAYVSEFEEKFANYLGVRHAIGLNSCTAALHLSLLALDIDHGDEVITTPMTFIATANAIMHAGATPVYVDVEANTGLINPDLIENAITNKTKAIIPVHLYGQMCDMVRIKEIAEKHNLKIIEDAAHCIEGERDGIKPGHLGDVACFSFYATKNITSGEGGAVCTNSKVIAEKIKLLRTHGMSREAADRHSGSYEHWDMLECGWKYSMDNIQAALLLPQLERIDASWEKRDALYRTFIQYIKDIPEVGYPAIIENSKSAYHLFTIWVDAKQRDHILHHLRDAGIGVAVNYRAIHSLTYFKEKFGYKTGDFPVAEEIGRRTISLPFWLDMDAESARRIFVELKKVVSDRN